MQCYYEQRSCLKWTPFDICYENQSHVGSQLMIWILLSLGLDKQRILIQSPHVSVIACSLLMQNQKQYRLQHASLHSWCRTREEFFLVISKVGNIKETELKTLIPDVPWPSFHLRRVLLSALYWVAEALNFLLFYVWRVSNKNSTKQG